MALCKAIVRVAVVPAIVAATTAQEPPAADRPVFRVSVTSVQINAVVTDRSGRRVTDLTESDFEVLQDGRPQPIGAFRYVPIAGAAAAPPKPGAVAVPLQGRQLRRDDVRR